MQSAPSTSNRYFDENEGILYTTTIGDVDFQAMLQNEQKVAQLARFTKNLKILEDAREAKASFDVNELERLVELLEIHLRDFDSVRHAVVHKDPTATAYVMLVSHLNPISKYRIKVFSTLESAKKWLMADEQKG